MKDGVRSPTSADRSLGTRVKHRRRAVGMSQSALGDKIGVSFRQVQKYENGINRIGVSRLEEIAQALNVPIAHFLSRPVESPPSGQDVEDFLELPEAAELAAALVKIRDPALRRQIVDLAKSIALLFDASKTEASELA